MHLGFRLMDHQDLHINRIDIINYCDEHHHAKDDDEDDRATIDRCSNQYAYRALINPFASQCSPFALLPLRRPRPLRLARFVRVSRLMRFIISGTLAPI